MIGTQPFPRIQPLRPADLARTASVGLRTRPLRAVLSALGIAIGIAAMVAVLGLAWARWASPTRASAWRAWSRRARAGWPAYNRPSATLSSADWCSARWNCWNTNPMDAARTAAICRSVSWPTSRPPIRTVPVAGRSSVPIMCSRVDLPDPDGPTTAASSPRRMTRSTPRRACTGGCVG